MLKYLSSLLDWLRSLFWAREMEICLIGLQNAGKSSLVNVLVSGEALGGSNYGCMEMMHCTVMVLSWSRFSPC